jgi:hypothetical protein
MKNLFFILFVLISTISFTQSYNNGQRVFNVKLFGATGNGVYDTTGAITSGGGALSTVTSLFTAADVGKVIVVLGAGTSGRDLVTTIATFTDATHVGLTANASTTVSSNGRIIYGTDQTTFIQAAITAAKSIGNGSIVFIPNGVYIIAGALQTSVGGVNMNSQIYIPADSIQSLKKTNITIQGETAPNCTQYGVLTSYNLNDYTGTVLVSTLTSGATDCSVIGTKGFTGTFGTFNYNYLTVKNLAIKVLDNPAGAGAVIGGISMKFGSSLITNQVMINPIGIGTTSVTPTNDISGIETPDISSEAMTWLTNTGVGGFKTGYKIGEHADMEQAHAYACYYGFAIKQGYHNVHGGRILTHWCTNDIYNIAGSVPPSVKIDALDVEYMTAAVSGGKWYDNINTINDSLNQIKGTMYFTLVSSSVGLVNTHFTKNGGSNFSAYAIGDSSNLAVLNGNNVYSITSGVQTQYFIPPINGATGFVWQYGGNNKMGLYFDFDGLNKHDLKLYNYKTATAVLNVDSANTINLGGTASTVSTSGLSITSNQAVYAPFRIGIAQTTPGFPLDITATGVGLSVANGASGSYAGARFINNGSSLLIMGKAGSAFSFASIAANDFFFENTASGNITIQNDVAAVGLTGGGLSTHGFRVNTNNSIAVPATITAGGTTGNQTINKSSGTVNFAASATSLTVTNSLVTTSSIVFAIVRTNDATAEVKNVVCSSGSFVITLTAAATAETSVGFFVLNNY